MSEKNQSPTGGGDPVNLGISGRLTRAFIGSPLTPLDRKSVV